MGSQHALLLVVDLQRVVAPGGAWEIDGVEPIIDAANRLVERHRGPVLASRHVPVPDRPGSRGPFGSRDDPSSLTQDAAQLVPSLAHLPSIAKQTYSLYRHADVREAARQAECTILCGVETDCCVLATVFDLLDDGRPTVVVEDAVTGPDPLAHDGALRAMHRLGDLVQVRALDDLVP